MKPNLRSFDRGVRLVLGIGSIFYALAIAHGLLAQIAGLVFGGFCLGEAITSSCMYLAACGVKTQKQSLSPAALAVTALHIIQLVLAFQWASAGWEKITSADFIAKMPDTLQYFASQNPYPWFKSFLLLYAVPSASWFGWFVEWGELLVGIGLVVGIAVPVWSKQKQWVRLALELSVWALAGAMLMNAMFDLAAGWISVAVGELNVLMFWAAAALLYVKIQTLLDSPKNDEQR